jgi:hypothetical protein
MANEAPGTDALLARAAAGERAAWGALLAARQEELMRRVAFAKRYRRAPERLRTVLRDMPGGLTERRP